jgi:hypothetical protein
MAGLGGAVPPGVPVPPVPPGGAVPRVNVGLPPAPLPAYLVPSPAHGDISRVVTAMHGGDLERFLALINTEMTNMHDLLVDPGGVRLAAQALGVRTGPCAFLVVPPPLFMGVTHVEVIHCI